jgi:probable H4MPT-linked C1 transfer pathway protein
MTSVGWDIGGAHLKMVVLDESGAVLHAHQLPCPLWKGLNHLEDAINDAQKHALRANIHAASRAHHSVTMTGELVDLFANRHEGVVEISNLATKLLGKKTLYYAASLPNQNHGFVRPERVSEVWQQIASANWHASASALATHVSDALLVDIGSTTTDIITISNGKVTATSLSDASRMADDSLVYTGVVRTPVMALAQKIVFENVETNVAAEYFATMADVYRLTGELLPEFDQAETADGKGKTLQMSARRLARMIGHDVETYDFETWINLAITCKKLQMQQIKTAVMKHLKPNMTILGAGAGSFLVKQIADDLNRPFKQAWEATSMRVAEHLNIDKKAIETCFTAFAVATLAKNNA